MSDSRPWNHSTALKRNSTCEWQLGEMAPINKFPWTVIIFITFKFESDSRECIDGMLLALYAHKSGSILCMTSGPKGVICKHKLRSKIWKLGISKNKMPQTEMVNTLRSIWIVYFFTKSNFQSLIIKICVQKNAETINFFILLLYHNKMILIKCNYKIN